MEHNSGDKFDELYQTSAVLIPDPEIEEFSWKVVISPRSKIQRNIESVTFGGFNFNGLEFRSGFLAVTDHRWGFSIYSNQVNAYMQLPRRDLRFRYTVHKSKLELMSRDEVKATQELTFTADESAAAPRMLWSSFWVNNDRSWDDTVDAIRIIFKVGRESRQCTYTSASQDIAIRYKKVLGAAKVIDCKQFFMSEFLSDVIIECKGVEFHAHRFLLSCRSDVFSRMFQVGMKEKEEGRVVIEDMEPQVLEELLRYMYCSCVSPQIGDSYNELFQAADKYNIESLKIFCENEMVKRVNPENVLEMYMTAEVHDAKLLKEKAFDVLRANKKLVLHDRDTFKMFTSRYPDIAYSLFSYCG